MRYPYGESEAGVGRQKTGEIISKKPPNYTRSQSVEERGLMLISCSRHAPPPLLRGSPLLYRRKSANLLSLPRSLPLKTALLRAKKRLKRSTEKGRGGRRGRRIYDSPGEGGKLMKKEGKEERRGEIGENRARIFSRRNADWGSEIQRG